MIQAGAKTARTGIRALLVALGILVCMPHQPAVTAQQLSATPAPQPSPAQSQSSYQITVDASKQWVDTSIDLRPGESLRFTASGEITYPAQGKSKERTFDADGLPRGFTDVIHQYAVGDAGHGALVGRLGLADTGQPFLIGASKDFSAPVAGRLFLGINQSSRDASLAQGSFSVTITVLDPGSSASAGSEAAGGPAETPIPSITSDLLEQIPRRVLDAQGNLGDMVNVLIVGSEAELVQVFTTAGWVKVDTSVESTVVSGILNTLEKKNYLTMPMSKLYLFDRVQDYGFAHAEPVRVAMARNHLRAWKSPYQVDGRPLWCIAATHDIGFERDQRNNGVTHKIDPAIDGEREFVNATLSSTGLVTQRTHVTPSAPLTEANTATGGTFHSDGRILVLVLKEASSH
jgi:hypothetical protein